MLYDSDETGRSESYLRPFVPDTREGAAPGPKLRLSTEGAAYPTWRRDGREVFFRSGGKLWAMDVRLGAMPQIGAPRALFDARVPATSYVPLADGRQFLFVEQAGEQQSAKIDVVLNWLAEVKR